MLVTQVGRHELRWLACSGSMSSGHEREMIAVSGSHRPRLQEGYRTVWPAQKHDASTVGVLLRLTPTSGLQQSPLDELGFANDAAFEGEQSSLTLAQRPHHLEALDRNQHLLRGRGARPGEGAARTLQGQAHRLPAAHPGAGPRRQRLRAPLAGLRRQRARASHARRDARCTRRPALSAQL